MDVQALSDTIEIQNLLTRYVFAIDDKDFDRLDRVFTPDATMDYTAAGGVKGNWSQIKPWLRAALGRYPKTQHLIGLPDIMIDGDRARSRVMLMNPMQCGPELRDEVFLCGCVYSDTLIRTADGWRITHRVEEGKNFWFKDVPPDMPPAPPLEG
jgi:hypothetical protein